ncbi:MAG: methyltransferase domain-containing protein [Anaerolineaceae bacterium]|nr:methyltransferase domain-containing protein [Anaerolineaceae bacterium]
MIKASLRVNIGCGPNPIQPGWLNFDNSISVRLAAYPLVLPVLERLDLLEDGQKKMIRACQKSPILWADASRSIPLPDGSVKVLYSSHMIEHLDREQAQSFLKEAFRVLEPDGIIRLAAPDLEKMAEEYLKNGCADTFVAKTLLAAPRPVGLKQKIKLLLAGHRHHLWMYDGKSLMRMLHETGFSDVHILGAGETLLDNPAGIDLYERMEESVYVEGHKGVG